MPSAPAIGFEYRPSRVLLRAYVAVAASSFLAIGLSGLPWWGKLLAILAVLAAIWRAWPRLAHTAVAAVGWSADNQWTLHLVSADDLAATLLSFRVLGPFVLLRLQAQGLAVQTLLLGSDNSDIDIRRRLRMRLAILQPGEAVPRI